MLDPRKTGRRTNSAAVDTEAMQHGFVAGMGIPINAAMTTGPSGPKRALPRGSA